MSFLPVRWLKIDHFTYLRYTYEGPDQVFSKDKQGKGTEKGKVEWPYRYW